MFRESINHILKFQIFLCFFCDEITDLSNLLFIFVCENQPDVYEKESEKSNVL